MPSSFLYVTPLCAMFLKYLDYIQDMPFQCTFDVVDVFPVFIVYLKAGKYKKTMVTLHNGIYIFGDFCTMVAVSWHLWIFLLNVNRTA